MGEPSIEEAAKAKWARDVRATTPSELSYWDRYLVEPIKDWYRRSVVKNHRTWRTARAASPEEVGE